MTAAIVLLSVITAILTLLVVGLLRSHAEILRRLNDLGAALDEGRNFPAESPHSRDSGGGSAEITGLTPGGDPVAVQVTGLDQDTIVAFLSSNCITCQTFWDAFRAPRKLDLPGRSRLLVVTKGIEAESASVVAQLAPPALPTIMSSAAFDDYRVPGSPYFVHISGPSGQVRSKGTGNNWDQVAALLAQPTSESSTD